MWSNRGHSGSKRSGNFYFGEPTEERSSTFCFVNGRRIGVELERVDALRPTVSMHIALEGRRGDEPALPHP
jgi:hypothetical protein